MKHTKSHISSAFLLSVLMPGLAFAAADERAANPSFTTYFVAKFHGAQEWLNQTAVNLGLAPAPSKKEEEEAGSAPAQQPKTAALETKHASAVGSKDKYPSHLSAIKGAPGQPLDKKSMQRAAWSTGKKGADSKSMEKMARSTDKSGKKGADSKAMMMMAQSTAKSGRKGADSKSMVMMARSTGWSRHGLASEMSRMAGKSGMGGGAADNMKSMEGALAAKQNAEKPSRLQAASVKSRVAISAQASITTADGK